MQVNLKTAFSALAFLMACALAMPVLADSGKLDDQLKAIVAAIADADAKAEKACVLAKIKLRQQAVEDLAAAKKEAMRTDNLEMAVEAKKKAEAVSGEMDALLASAGVARGEVAVIRTEKPEVAKKEQTKLQEGDNKKAGQAIVLQQNGRFVYTIRKNGTCDYGDTASGFTRKGTWTSWGASGVCMSFTDGGEKAYFYKRDKKGDTYCGGDKNGPNKDVIWDCTRQ